MDEITLVNAGRSSNFEARYDVYVGSEFAGQVMKYFETGSAVALWAFTPAGFDPHKLGQPRSREQHYNYPTRKAAVQALTGKEV